MRPDINRACLVILYTRLAAKKFLKMSSLVLSVTYQSFVGTHRESFKELNVRSNGKQLKICNVKNKIRQIRDESCFEITCLYILAIRIKTFYTTYVKHDGYG